MDSLHLETSQRPAVSKFGDARNALVRNLFVAFLLTAYATANAATISAASCAAADVQTALNLAKAGDTVELPAGSASWTSGITWTAPANVTLKGAGTNTTGGGDKTVITDNSASGSQLLKILVSPAGVFRMTGITFQSGNGALKDSGTIQIVGPGNVRLDHLHLKMSSVSNYKAIWFGGGIRGVLDSSILDFTGTNALYFYNGRSHPSNGEYQGNYEWAQPTAFGTSDFFFIEDNIINGAVSGGAYSTRVWDGFTAAKVVTRFNTLAQACINETHPTGHGPDDRGTRAQESYGNLITSDLLRDPNYTMSDVSNGVALIWGNYADRVYKFGIVFRVTRGDNTTYTQTATTNGWGYAGTKFNGTGSMWDGGTALGTDPVYGYPAIDQAGRGQGDLLTGNFPSKLNSKTGTLHWPNQALEPVYLWNNNITIVPGWSGSFYNPNVRVVANRDYYPQASGIQTSPSSPFDGTSGTGWGTLANRPTTCTPGVAYWAMDQGLWNQSASNPYGVQMNGADGVLYKCTAPNTWTLYYEPYTYPHPLRVPGAPQNVKINVLTEATQ